MSLSRVLIAGHTLISIVAIIVGVFALKDLFRAQASSTSLTAFIAFAIATTATGFILPLNGISPAVVISIMALIILAAVLLSRGRLKGSRWARWVYVGGLVASEYLLIFVGVVQAFTKVPPLKVLAIDAVGASLRNRAEGRPRRLRRGRGLGPQGIQAAGACQPSFR